MEGLDEITIHFNRNTALILNLSLGVIMFSVALGLTIDDFKRVCLQPKGVFLGLFSQFVVLPLFTFLLVLLVKPYPSIALGMFMVAACPGGNVSNFMSDLAGGNVALSVSLSAVATVLSIVMTPFSFTFWSGMYAPTSGMMESIDVSTWEMIQTVFIIMAVPLILGMWCRSKYLELTKRVERPIKTLALVIFGGIVLSALYINFEAFWSNMTYVFAIVVAHNTIALSSGFLLGKAAKLPWPDVKSLSIETGIQNSGLGLLLIFTFFGGLGGMALVAAWWGVWHIISGLSISYFWQGKAKTS